MNFVKTKIYNEKFNSQDPLYRLENLLDYGSLLLLHKRDSSGVLAATGKIKNVNVVAFCTDATFAGGAMGVEGCIHIVDAYKIAIKSQIPIIGIWHSGGARISDGVKALHGVGLVFESMIQASGLVPQISLIVSFAAGGAAYGPALTDIVVMSKKSKVFVTGPDVISSVTGEIIDMTSLGGSEVHSKKSGVCHIVADNELDVYKIGRRLILLFSKQGSFIYKKTESMKIDPSLFIPKSFHRVYDVHPVIKSLLDKDTIFDELQPKWAPSIVIGFSRLACRTIGVVANNPLHLGGCLNSESAEKAARFVRLCNTFDIPIVAIVDSPGYLPGVDQEWGGLVRRGAKLLHAFGECSVPRVTLVTRKVYGGAYIAMNSRSLKANKVLAWPNAKIDVMGSKAAVNILYKKKLAVVPNDKKKDLENKLTKEHELTSGSVNTAINIGVVDEKIEPIFTRNKLIQALSSMIYQHKTHKNIPL